MSVGMESVGRDERVHIYQVNISMFCCRRRF